MANLKSGRHRCTGDNEPLSTFHEPGVDPDDITSDVGAQSWNGPHKTGYKIETANDDESNFVVHGKHEFVQDDDGLHLVSQDGKKIATFHDCHAERDDDGNLHLHHGRDRRIHDGFSSTSTGNDVARIRLANKQAADFWKQNEWNPAGSNRSTALGSKPITSVADLQRRNNEFWSKQSNDR